jgi:large subunit ribosomal protein L23
MTNYWEIIERPLVSEKSIAGADRGKYVFRVKLTANKVQIRQAIESLYKVKVKDVNTMRVRGKTRRIGRFPEGRTTDWKKAIVTLAPGERIDVLENV